MASQGGLCLFAGLLKGAFAAFGGGQVVPWESFVVPDGRNRRVCQSRVGRCSP